jgi:cation diffusion facilitator CzcD-associated flavoprotein CzcO
MHSAQWVDGTDLAGKRVAVVGTGASAFQIVPTIAGEVAHLDVFQRSAPWMFPNPNYHEQVGRVCGGPSATSRTTGAGTASCCSGRRATAA